MRRIFLYSLLLAIMGTSLAPAPLRADSYAIPEIRVEVDLRPDGTLRITEHRTYEYDGEFSWANYRLPKKGFSRIRDIRVAEGDSIYVNRNTEKAGTFLVEESPGAVNLRWFYEAEDQRRTFTLSYILEGSVVVGPEWSEFFWNFLAAGREKSTDSLHVTIRMPETTDADSLHSWARGPVSRITINTDSTGYSIEAHSINASDFVKFRTVFPTYLFDRQLVEVSNPGYSLEWARRDEREFRRQQQLSAEREARRSALGEQLSVLIAVLSIAVFVFLYRKYGRRHNVSGTASSRKSLQIPGSQRPAAIGWLLSNRNTTGGHLMATLLDLARRGYFTLREQEGEEGWFSDKKPVFTIEWTGREAERDLLEWERSMLEFITGRLGDEERELGALFKKNSGAVSKWFSSWKKEVKSYCFDKGWIDEQSYTGAWWNAGLQAALLAASAAPIALAGPLGIIPAAVALMGAVFSLAIIRRTPEGEKLYRNWKGYREGLSEAEDHSVSDAPLDRHFIYAVAFGAREKTIEALFRANPNAAANMGWIVLISGGHTSPASLAKSFSTLQATGAAAFGGAAGAAGGASAGAAGGGASGGAG